MIDLSTNDTQRSFIFNRVPYSAYYGGVGNGKTTAGIARCFLLSMAYPGNFGLIGRKTYPELRDTTQKEFLDLVRAQNGGTLDPGPIVKQFIKAENLLIFQNGSKIIFRHLDEMEKILSLNLGFFYIDQAEEIGEDVWKTLVGRLRYWNPAKVREWQEQHLEDGERSEHSADYKTFKIPVHYAFITGNPHPGWVYRWFIEKPPSKKYKIYEASSAANAANLPAGFVEDLREQYDEDYAKRFIDGKWDAFAGQIYKSFSETIHCVPKFEIPGHWKRIISMDHGFTNPTCFLWGAVDEHGNLFIYKEHYEASKTVDHHSRVVSEMCQNEPVSRFEGRITIWADPSTKGKDGITGRSVMEQYRMGGLLLRPANNHVEAGILRCQELFALDPNHMHPISHQKLAPKIYIFKRQCPNLVEELKEYQWEKQKEGVEKNRSEKPRKHYDHACDTLRYMVMSYYKPSDKKATKEVLVDKYRQYVKTVMQSGPNSTEQQGTPYSEY